jgi:hypothetical protein
MSQTVRSSVAVSQVSTARLAAALEMCVRGYRHATLDCPLAAGIVALHSRRPPRGVAPSGRGRMKETIRRFLAPGGRFPLRSPHAKPWCVEGRRDCQLKQRGAVGECDQDEG